MSKSTLILIIILFLSTGGLLILALNKSLYNPTQVIQPPTPSIKPVLPETSLLFGKLETATSSGIARLYLLPIIINTGTNKVTTVQLELSFDPSILTNVSIAPSTFFKNPNVIINKIHTDTGKVFYALAATQPEGSKQGEGMLATFAFESKMSSGSSTITFLPRTFVTAEGLESSALKSTNSAQLLLQSKLGN